MQKFNARHAIMQFLAYHSIPLSVPCVFWKFEVRERLGLKIGGFVLRHFNHCRGRYRKEVEGKGKREVEI